MNCKFLHVLGVSVVSAAVIAIPSAYAQELSATSPTSTPQIPVPPPLNIPTPPVPELFDASSTNMQAVGIPTSTQPLSPPIPAPATSTQPIPPMPGVSNGDASSTPRQMIPIAQGDQEDIVVSSDDSPAVRLRKLARYWAVYREIGSTSMYAITVSGTKREIKTLDFFNKIDSNFGMRLMPKGSLDQFTTGDAITSVDGLDLKSFRKLAEPCRLIKTADKPTVYLACLGVKRAILNEKAFKTFGWDFKQVQKVNRTDVDQMKDGEAVSEATVFDQGVNIETPAGQDESAPQASTPTKNDKKTTSNVSTKGARIVKLAGDSKIYIITADGKRHRLLNMDVVKSLKLDLSKVQTLTEDQFKAYPEGDPISLGNTGKEPNSQNSQQNQPGEQHPPMMPPMPTGSGTSTMLMPPRPEPEHPTSTASNVQIGYILRLKGGDAYYLVIGDQKVKHRVYSTQALSQMGLKLQQVREVGQDDLDALTDGDPIGVASTTGSSASSTSVGEGI